MPHVPSWWSKDVRLADVNEHQLAVVHGVRGDVTAQNHDGVPKAVWLRTVLLGGLHLCFYGL